MNFTDFSIGDYIFFSKTFSLDDFENFKDLSGDNNRLHFDRDYAQRTSFKNPILPLHMVCLPLSKVAGVYFPGESSLYLQHSIKAIKPTFYFEELIYSAVVKEINYSLRVMLLDVLVIRNHIEVAIEAKIHVQSRSDEWVRLSEKFAKKNKNIFVVGLSEDMVDPFFSRFLKNGWQINFVISSSIDLLAIEKWNKKYPGQINITRSPHVSDIMIESTSSVLMMNGLKIDNHYNFNLILDKFLPKFLKEQNGRFINVINSCQLADEDFMIDYQLISHQIEKINKNYSKYGITCETVQNNLCEDFDVEELFDLLEKKFSDEILQELSMLSNTEDTAFIDGNPSIDKDDSAYVKNEIKSLMVKLFNLPKNYKWQFEGLGKTPGWDSFGHILLMLEIEKRMGIKFVSDEYETTYEFQGLVDAALTRYRASN